MEKCTTNKYDKTISDYYDQMCQLFPTVPKSDIKRICNYGWKALYLHNSYGGDVVITDHKFWSYIGFLKTDSIQWFKQYIKKLVIKLRVLYKRKHIQFNNTYYFALNQEQFDKLLSQKNKKGRPKKKFIYGDVYIYKILDECKVREFNKQYIFKLPVIADFGFKYHVKNLISDQAELMITREKQKFKDLLVSNNIYDLI